MLVRRLAATAEGADAYGPDGLLDGGVKLYGEYGPLRGAEITNALLDAAPPLDAEMSRGQRLAIGLEPLAEEHLAGGPGRRAKPLLNVLVDLSQVTTDAAGNVDLHIDGPLATLTARTVEALTDEFGDPLPF